MQLTEQQPTKLRLHNWEALQQLERERDWLSQLAAGIGAVGIADAVIASLGFLLMATDLKIFLTQLASGELSTNDQLVTLAHDWTLKWKS